MMMTSPLPLLLLALTTALAAPPASYEDYPEVIVPQKRAALVLDRLLVALQKALHDDVQTKPKYERPDREGPRAAPLRLAHVDDNDMIALSAASGPGGWPLSKLQDYDFPRAAPLRAAALQDDMSALQRRGQGGGRGRVLRCYFNAVTCF